MVCKAAGIDETGVGTFTTDGPHFRPLCSDIIIFGPGQSSICHKPDESIEIDQLQKAKDLYVKIIQKILLQE